MNHKEQISAWVDAHREAFLEDVKTLCRIDSSKGAGGARKAVRRRPLPRALRRGGDAEGLRPHDQKLRELCARGGSRRGRA